MLASTPPVGRLVAVVGALILSNPIGQLARPAADTRELSAAVLSDGFAALDGTPSDRHVVIVGRDNLDPIRRAVPVTAAEARMVGASSTVGIGWRDGNKLRFAPLTGDGQLGAVSSWGTKVTRLCEGVATNDRRWGISWLENDRTVWVLHGPTNRRELTASGATLAITSAAPIEWCRVASAGDGLVLVWGDPLERTFLGRCTEKRCEPASQLSTGNSQIVNLSCNSTACAAVARKPNGSAELAWFNIKNGRAKWRKPFAVEDKGQWFSIAAIGETGFAIGYLSNRGPTVVRVADKNTVARVWSAEGDTAPQIVWAVDRLLIAHRRDGELALDLVALR